MPGIRHNAPRSRISPLLCRARTPAVLTKRRPSHACGFATPAQGSARLWGGFVPRSCESANLRASELGIRRGMSPRVIIEAKASPHHSAHEQRQGVSPPAPKMQTRPQASGRRVPLTRDLIIAAAVSSALTGFAALVVDRPVGLWLELREPWTRPEAVWIGSAAVTIPIVVLTAAALVLGMGFIVRMCLGRVEAIERARRGSTLVLAAAAASLLSMPLKHLIGRARPLVMNDPFLFQPLTVHDVLTAFPSSQAALAGALATALSVTFPRFRTGIWMVGLFICGSRVLAGAHWVSDVVAGWSLGMVAALLLWRRVFQPSPETLTKSRSSHAANAKNVASEPDTDDKPIIPPSRHLQN